MELLLQRKTEVNNTVLGELFINGSFFCYTLEDKIRDVKIKHETCIPEGSYNIIITPSARFKEILPLLQNVPNFSGIRIHAGNTIEDTSGCILVGSAIKGEMLLYSKITVSRLISKLQTALKKEKVKIEVKNPTPIKEVLPKVVKTPKEVEEIVDKIIQDVASEPIIPLPIKDITPQTKQSKFTIILNLIKQWLTNLYPNS